MIIIRTILISLIMLISTPIWAHHYTFGIVPQQSASRLAKQWAPILKALSEETGHEFVFKTTSDIPTFEKNLAKGEYSFAYMNPYHFVVFNQSPGYQAVAKAKNKKIKGIIVVKKDSNITQIEQLNNSEMAFPAPASFAASILPQAYLNAANVNYTPKYVSSHDSVYLAIARGFFPAGGGVMRTFNAMPPEIKEQLNPIWTTKGYTPHAIAALPSIDSKLLEQVQHFFSKLASTPEGQKVLEPLKINAFMPAKNSDWDDVRALDIDLIQTK
ncbi:phosphate/phosphite/phosphonate ABC transporter substrate-binding protein [Vibrio sp. DW001]|uniref:phosphate/phosphite/phosphonate ABC transporter substrate-binding protein n=1 Tax=Vibrio sp. DW001 TaxID=2912315 RepID=UPI0023B12E95|nr:phosphate/phosphite/phosphonate ABC transporter substrate-binding protein [Vibrio sp. DW001]WED28503.1 phosphate/phosphite/phosphonate ABC transporter substrate-binding protein [Vibrio sp. DW001]